MSPLGPVTPDYGQTGLGVTQGLREQPRPEGAHGIEVLGSQEARSQEVHLRSQVREPEGWAEHGDRTQAGSGSQEDQVE